MSTNPKTISPAASERPVETRKIYTRIRGSYVMPAPGDISILNLDSCLVGKNKKCLFVRPLEDLAGHCAERQCHSSDPVFGLSSDESEKFLIVNGVKLTGNCCSICRDRLNGMTGNCFDYQIKPKGCIFQPLKPPAPFRIDLSGWQKIKPTDVSTMSPFAKPYSPSDASFDSKTMAQNRKMRRIRYHFWEFRSKKEEKYCSRCIYQGLCYFNCRTIAEHCMVTEEKTLKGSLSKIRSKFGSVEEFLKLLSFSGKPVYRRPPKGKRKNKWLVSRPENRRKFTLRQLNRPFEMISVSRNQIEKQVKPDPVYSGEDRDRVAALCWYFMKQFMTQWGCVSGFGGRVLRPFWVTPKPGFVELIHYPYGWRLALSSLKFRSFNDILRYDR